MSKAREELIFVPGIYVWKVTLGWRFRVFLQFAGTSAIWRPTKKSALRAAYKIVDNEY